MTQEELEAKGGDLATVAIATGLDSLSDEEVMTLLLYATWKDGADWWVVKEFMRDPWWKVRGNIIHALTMIHGYFN